jgi:hypothetical protein
MLHPVRIQPTRSHSAPQSQDQAQLNKPQMQLPLAARPSVLWLEACLLFSFSGFEAFKIPLCTFGPLHPRYERGTSLLA